MSGILYALRVRSINSMLIPITSRMTGSHSNDYDGVKAGRILPESGGRPMDRCCRNGENAL